MNVYFRCTVGNGGGGGGDATLTVLGSATLAGITCTCTDGITTLTQTFPSTSPYDITFNIPNEGTWTVSVIVDGITHSETVQISLNQTIDIGVFNLQNWLTAGRVIDTYSTLAQVLEDEATLRQLFLVHDSVDYLCNRFVDNSIETIFNCDLAAKWINLSDYALDTFYAVPAIKTVMDTADKYGYGEWTLMPQVPTMTSNTAPYGEAFGTNLYGNYNYYWVFDKSESTEVLFNAGGSNNNVGYKFTSPIKPEKVKAVIRLDTASGVTTPNRTFTIQGSNDNSTWDDVGTFVVQSGGDETIRRIEANLESSSSYLYVRAFCGESLQTTNSWSIRIKELQFYAWAPKGNVPVMTSNSAPYGTAAASSVLQSGKEAYRVFDNNSSTEWHSAAGAAQWITYEFPNPVCAKRVKLITHTVAGPKTSKIKASNDGTNWTEIGDFVDCPNASTEYTADYNNENYYKYYKFDITESNYVVGGTPYVTFVELQFYGRELKVSVPTMTSNTAPYGEAIYSGQYSMGTSSWPAWKAFNGTNTNEMDSWVTTPILDSYIGYHFPSKVVIKAFTIQNRNFAGDPNARIHTFQLQTSNDGSTWTDVGAVIDRGTSANAANYLTYHECETDEIEYIRIQVKSDYSTSDLTGAGEIQFYGLDYSEKEFEAGTTKKWLYDHGVELEEIRAYASGSGEATKKENGIYLYSPNDQVAVASNDSAIDLTDYSLLRAKFDPIYTSLSNGTFCELAVMNSKPTSYSDTGALAYTDGTAVIKDNIACDITSFNEERYVGTYFCSANYNTKFDLKELWLEP